MKKFLLVSALASVLAVTSYAQNPNVALPTNSPSFDTNGVKGILGLTALGEFGLNLLPYWDKTQTNSFAAHEIELEVGPLWKSVTASGATPFLSIGGEYFFTRSVGAGANIVTFGQGNGASDIDSAHAFLLLRKDRGNVAGHLVLGGGRDVNNNRYDAEFGGGLEFRWLTGIGMKVETKYLKFIESKIGFPDHDFHTSVTITTHF